MSSPSDRAANVANFIERAREQLIEKRKQVKSLGDAEKLFKDEQNFCLLLERNFLSLTPREKIQSLDLLVELKGLQNDFGITNAYREKYTAARSSDLQAINDIEKRLSPRPNFKIISSHAYADDHGISTNETVPELGYRFKQAVKYFEQNLEQHCSYVDPREQAAEEKYLTQGSAQPLDLNQLAPPATRIPSRDYIVVPGNTWSQELERVTNSFLEECITLGAAKSGLCEFLPLIALEESELANLPE